MINTTHALSLTRQAELLELSRASLYYQPVPVSEADLRLMRRIDELHLEWPFLGSRMLRDLLVSEGFTVGRKHVATLMRRMGLQAIYRRANTSHRILSWCLSNSLTADFCLEALEEAIARHGSPEIFNTDQGSQFTAMDFVGVLTPRGIRVSMDGRGAWRDNVFVERLWRSIKYEEVYLHAYDSVSAAKAGIARNVTFYNTRRPHISLDRQTPDHVYFKSLPLAAAA